MEERIESIIAKIQQSTQNIQSRPKSWLFQMKYIGYTIPEDFGEDAIEKVVSELSKRLHTHVKYDRSKRRVLVRLNEYTPTPEDRTDGLRALNQATEDYLNRIIKPSYIPHVYTHPSSQRPYKARDYQHPTKSSS